MANKTPPITTAAQVARRRVIRRAQGEVFTLPVNPQFKDPNKIDESRGVDYPEARECALAEAGMAIAVQNSLFSRLPLRTWLGRQFRRRGGAARFVDDLLGLEPAPAGADPEKFRRALLRSVERAGPAASEAGRKQSHGSIRNLAYQRRIAHYVLETGRRKPEVVAGVTGVWEEEHGDGVKREVYRGFRTDPDEPEEVKAVFAALMRPDGAGLIETVIEAANSREYSYLVNLVALHGLHIELTEVV